MPSLMVSRRRRSTKMMLEWYERVFFMCYNRSEQEKWLKFLDSDGTCKAFGQLPVERTKLKNTLVDRI